MIENTRGVVLRTRLLTETSLIVNWLTPDAGRISTVAKGALRPKSSFRGKMDLFYLAEFSFSRSRRSELHTLREVRILETHPALRRDLPALRQVSYCAALIEQTTETGTPLPQVYDLMLGLLSTFGFSTAGAPQEYRAEPVLAFELRLLQELGLEPNYEDSGISKSTRGLIEELLNGPWPEMSSIQAPAPQALELRRFLQKFLIYNFGRLARGRAAAIEIS